MDSYLKGEVPVVKVHQANIGLQEKVKYDQVWSDIPNYGERSPGLDCLDLFMSVVKPRSGSTILDIGCGTGAAGQALEKKGFQVGYLDISEEGLDPKVDRKRFICQPIWKPIGHGYMFDYGYCCDFMEHLAPEFTMLAASNILRCCTKVWFQISLLPDEFGKAIGQPLHLTVKEFTWWRDRLGIIGRLIDARDLGGKAIYVVTR